jgi:Fic family protein
MVALAHAQFETILPFLDGYGRTGRLLTTFSLCKLGILERPVLYLSEYFLNDRQSYYDVLEEYHSGNGLIFSWMASLLELTVLTSSKRLGGDAKILHERAGKGLVAGKAIIQGNIDDPVLNVH